MESQAIIEAALPPARSRGRLLRVLGVSFGVAVTIGGVIGMGILRTPGEVAAQLPQKWLFIGVWVVVGLYALLGTISVAELGTMLPRSGGFYVFVRRALGPYAGFVVGWSDWLSTCGTTAGAAIVMGEYTNALIPQLDKRNVALAVAVGFALLQWRGVRWGSGAQQFISLLKALALVALICACFILGGKGRAPDDATVAAVPLLAGMALVRALVVAMQGVIYTYDGWYNMAYFSEEVRHPERDIPRSMIGSILLVIGLYLLINLALLYVLPLNEIAGKELAVGEAARVIFGSYGATLISVLATISMFSIINAGNLIAPRILFAMSRDGLFSMRAVKVNRGGTPTITLFVSTVATVLFIFGTFNQVLAVLAFIMVVNYAATFVSVFVLRWREPDSPRPFRAWGYPWTTLLALLGSLAFLTGAVASDRRNSLYALLLLAASYPAFLLLKWTKARLKDEEETMN